MGMLAGIAAIVLTLCALLRRRLERSEKGERSFWNDRIRLVTFYNSRGAFGLRWPRTWMLPATSAAILAGLAYLGSRGDTVTRLGAGLALGGGLSNLRERLERGRVLDYLRFPKAPGRIRRWIFNLADAAIFLGGLCMILGELRRK